MPFYSANHATAINGTSNRSIAYANIRSLARIFMSFYIGSVFTYHGLGTCERVSCAFTTAKHMTGDSDTFIAHGNSIEYSLSGTFFGTDVYLGVPGHISHLASTIDVTRYVDTESILVFVCDGYNIS